MSYNKGKQALYWLIEYFFIDMLTFAGHFVLSSKKKGRKRLMS